ncbi:MAG: phytanoyl-CoA dioxygenase family protein [Gammaproteobacteria bacterium]|nr:phytanoyl-CoA dioxygenase family protein [Gammaproteobacteria bacterium]MDH3467780.1 phytanoyl-CoA dioxygenase family protein [Gammaproteobacteria bacterium]
MVVNLKDKFEKQGFVSPVTILNEQEISEHRKSLESAEKQYGPLHYENKIHTILRSAAELVSHPNMLDTVEQILGPDILLYNAAYIIKEANSPAHVSWHQDLTYWGLDSDDQVSVWLALSVADERSGCMRMIPGSHLAGEKPHDIGTKDPDNVLYQSQTVHDVNEQKSVHCPLRPGQASFHHGWTLHASLPNRSNDRRIGLNIQYIAPHVRQVKSDGYSALLVRGQDRYHHYTEEKPATSDFDPVALAWRKHMHQVYLEISANA